MFCIVAVSKLPPSQRLRQVDDVVMQRETITGLEESFSSFANNSWNHENWYFVLGAGSNARNFIPIMVWSVADARFVNIYLA